MAKEKVKRVIHINVEDETVTETTVTGLEDMQKLVGGLIEVVGPVNESGDELYVNEEGLLGDPKKFFMFNGRPFALSGFVMGDVDSRGNSTSAKSKLEDISSKVIFFTGTE